MPMQDDGPFPEEGRDATSEMARSLLQLAKMQHEIIPHIEEMAQKLAAAGVASFMVTGDAPDHAIYRWVDVLRNRALALLRDKMQNKTQSGKEVSALEAKKLEDGK